MMMIMLCIRTHGIYTYAAGVKVLLPARVHLLYYYGNIVSTYL